MRLSFQNVGITFTTDIEVISFCWSNCDDSLPFVRQSAKRQSASQSEAFSFDTCTLRDGK